MLAVGGGGGGGRGEGGREGRKEGVRGGRGKRIAMHVVTGIQLRTLSTHVTRYSTKLNYHNKLVRDVP